mmetsp:Transcript_127675/g.355317  ORF Transcript_127675/g.355317 Transcript_127675/m.355317 type:complete len:266 (+) Transcript_127675:52-849(+)
MPCLSMTFSHSDLLAASLATVLVAGFVSFQHTAYGFIFQNVIGAGLLCTLQRQVRLPNLKIASVFLSTMFFFDIFWVFLSPMLFQKSVMLEVATGGGTGKPVPMLIRVPSSSGYGDKLLGFGDIALPGLLASYLLRFDAKSQHGFRKGYFLPGLVSYSTGLLATMVALVISGHGQPALLYLVPATLGCTVLLGWYRGELGLLWQGIPDEEDTQSCGGDGKCVPTGVAAAQSPPKATRRPRTGTPHEEEEEYELQPIVIGAENWDP